MKPSKKEILRQIRKLNAMPEEEQRAAFRALPAELALAIVRYTLRSHPEIYVQRPDGRWVVRWNAA
jgi:hypothetical protein